MILNGVSYSEEELTKMVEYYHNHVTFKQPWLNNDMIGEIMLRSTSKTIKNLCLINKSAYKYCQCFWDEYFKQHSFQILIPRKVIPTGPNRGLYVKSTK